VEQILPHIFCWSILPYRHFAVFFGIQFVEHIYISIRAIPLEITGEEISVPHILNLTFWDPNPFFSSFFETPTMFFFASRPQLFCPILPQLVFCPMWLMSPWHVFIPKPALDNLFSRPPTVSLNFTRFPPSVILNRIALTMSNLWWPLRIKLLCIVDGIC